MTDPVKQQPPEGRAVEEEPDLVINLIADLVGAMCAREDGLLDSQAVSGNAEVMRFLAQRGRLVIDSDDGQRVVGRWPDAAGAQQ